MKQERIIRTMSSSEFKNMDDTIGCLIEMSQTFYPRNKINLEKWGKVKPIPVDMVFIEKMLLSMLWPALNCSIQYGHCFQHALNDDITLDVWKVRLDNEIYEIFGGNVGSEGFNDWRNHPPFKGNLMNEPTLYFFQNYIGGEDEKVKKLYAPIIILDLPYDCAGDGIAFFISGFPVGMVDEFHPCIRMVDDKPMPFLSIVLNPGKLRVFVKFDETEFREGETVLHQHWHREIVSVQECKYKCVRVEM